MKKFLPLLFLLFLFKPVSAFAAAVSWDGGGNGTCWADPLNWSTDALPGADDDVTIDVGATINFAPYYDVASGGTASGTFTPDESALFDNNISTNVNSGVAGTHTIIYDLGEGNAKTVSKYSVRSGSSVSSQAPRQWTFQGSDNGTDWTTLDVVTGQIEWLAYERRLYTSFSNSENVASFRYYRWFSMQPQSQWSTLYASELELFQDVADSAAMRTLNSLALGNSSGASAAVLNFDYDAISDGPLITDSGDLTIHPGAIMSHSPGNPPTFSSINVQVAGSMIVSGKIITDAKGLQGSEGDGAPAQEGSYNGGAGYGGQGGNGNSYSGGSTYGSLTQPTSLGSGGGQFNGELSYRAGSGGGAIKLDINGTLSVGGTISSNGGNYIGPSFSAGGGSGGSVYISASTLSGPGTIMANGGTGYTTSRDGAGGGGGGRIAVYYDNSDANLTYQAFGGTGWGTGGAGTIYVKDNAAASGNLIVDNNNQNPLTSSHTDRYFGLTTLNGDFAFNTLTIRNYGNLNIGPSDTIAYSSLDWSTKGIITDNGGTFALLQEDVDLTIPATSILYANTQKTFNSITVNGVLTHSGNRSTEVYKLNLTTTGDFTVNATGSVSTNKQGFAGSQGDGSPADDANCNGCGGGAYGGGGGRGISTTKGLGGLTYGSLTEPISLGSGGGQYDTSYPAGYGGGAIRLNVGGNLSIGGSISSNGGNSTTQISSPGGGSGGSIYITTASFSGSGVVSANGGNGRDEKYAAGGGGGRIAVYYDSHDSNLNYQAYGGGGLGVGGAGTIYIQDNDEATGNLLLDNNNQNPTANDFYFGRTTLNGTYTFNTLTIRNYANLNIGSSDTITYSSLDWSTKGVITDSGGTLALLEENTDLTIPVTSVLFANIPRTYNNLIANGVLTHSNNYDQETYKIDLTIIQNLTIGSSGSINADYKGYFYAKGLGTPTETGLSLGGNGGAGHGGVGGDGGAYHGGPVYGSPMEPITLGSGGGEYGAFDRAGLGGGAVRLNIGSSLTVNGPITANGGASATPYSGGGSGGSVYILSSSVSGSSDISAIGGNSLFLSSFISGGGAGGRIAIYYDDNTLSGNVTVNGGTGLNNGQSGTVFYKAKSGSVISTPFDTEDAGAVLYQLTWDETLPEGTDAKFQLRTAPDADGSPGEWSSWLGPNGADSYYTDPNGSETINDAHTDASDDQWFQYKMILNSSVGDTAVPTVSEVTLAYVVNTSPSVSITNSPTQTSTGTIAVQFTTSDPEESTITSYLLADLGLTLNEELTNSDTTAITLSSAAYLPSSGTILLDSEMISYTGKSGNDLTGLTRGVNTTRAAAHSTSTVVWINAATVTGDSGSISTTGTKTITWTPRTDISGLETSTATLKVLVNDGNSANQLASDTATSVTLDTKAPINGDIVIDSRLDRLVLTATDGNGIQMKISNDADLSSDDLNNDSGTWIDYTTPKTWVMASGTETVYISYKDIYGNQVGSTLSATAPTRPTSLLIQDASNPDTTEWRLFVSWAVADEPPHGFSYYQLYRSTDNETYSALTQVNTISQNFYLDEGLDNETTYYYRVTVIDDHGNESSYNPVSQTSGSASRSGVGLVPDGSAGGDYTPPLISDLLVSQVSATSALITWTTDELSNSTVGYSTDTSYQDEHGSVTVATSHSVTLSNLTPATKYYFRAISYDAVSNKGIEEDSSIYSFTTLSDSTGPVISQVNSAVGETSVGITWATNEPASSIVEYGLTNSYGSATSSATLVLGHSLFITGLSANTTYYYRVASTDIAGNSSTSPGYNFTTTDPTTLTLDTAAPSIADISVSEISAQSAKISWSTNEDADGKVEYGESETYERGIAEGNHDFNQSKNVILIGLTPETSYHYRVIAMDKAGNVNSSADATFTTSAASVLGELTQTGSSSGGSNAPAITSDGAAVSNLSGTSVTVSWKTSKKSTSQVFYRPKNSSDSPVSGGDATVFLTDHAITLTGLTPATAYEYQVKSTDVNGNFVLSSKYEFSTTLPDVASVKVTSVSENSATISWNTLVPTTSAVEYINSITGESKTFSDKSLVTNHTVTLSDLYADTVYAFQVLIKDESGNLARSSQYSFTTNDDAAGPSITAVNSRSTIVSGQNKVQTVITWSTNEPSGSLVEYSSGSTEGSDYEFSTPTTDDYVTNHIVVISNLKPATVYRYRVTSKDRSGNTSQSQAYVLLTPQKEVSALDLIFQNLEGVFGWTKKIAR